MKNQNLNTTNRNTSSKSDKKITSNSITNNIEKTDNDIQTTTDNMSNYVTGEYRSSSSHKFHNNEKDVSDKC